MQNLSGAIGRNRRILVLFALMVLLPVALFGILVVRAIRGERVRLAYEKSMRQRQVLRLTEADLTAWLFSTGTDSAVARAVVRYEVRGDGIVFPDQQLSVSAADWGELRPFDPAPPRAPLTRDVIAEQYFPRIQAFRRDVAAGRTKGAQYFRQLRALVVQPPGAADGYIIDVGELLAHVNARLAELTADAPFTVTTWIASERTSLVPAGALALEGFPFFALVFTDALATDVFNFREQAIPYTVSLLLMVTIIGSVFTYRAISHEARLARLRNDFVAAVSHEFRSPLSSILALAERLERVHDPDSLREYHRIIRQDAHRLGALVTRLLDFALIEGGRTVYSAERVDLREVVRGAVDACQHVRPAERIRLSGADGTPLWVRGDRTALQHAIQNVIENAAKYSPSDAPIEVDCLSSNGTHRIDVRDRGIGIPPDEQEKIFEKFYRARGVSGLNVQGVGIGLALVRHVVESHGGSVGVDSQPGAGSTFCVHLPNADG